MRLRLLLAIAAIGLSVIGVAATPQKKQRIPGESVGNSVIILGELGIPVGATVTIHGKKTDNESPVFQYTFVVDSINGIQLDSPKHVSVKGIYYWKPGTEATLKGHEEGTIKYQTNEDDNRGGKGDDDLGNFQKLYLSFHVNRVTKPADLKLGSNSE